MIALYWIFPKKIRWSILLVGSLFFYYFAGWEKLIFCLTTAIVVFLLGIGIERVFSSVKYAQLSMGVKKSKARFLLITGIITILILLIYSKIGNRVFRFILENHGLDTAVFQTIIIPLGISYYSFSLIGYLADVYWQKDKAEKNFFKFLLYMIYFPQILQGPIPRHKRLSSDLFEVKKFDYKTLCFGLQRAVWGYFKKLVIADRFGILSNTIWGDIDSYKGQFVIVALLSSVVYLYCDFSGCMDIALGISESLGVRLDENFKRPFFSKSAAEFWRRWHITLGTWFKDYVYMPLVINPGLITTSIAVFK